MKVPGTFDKKPKARIWEGAIPGTHEPGFTEEPVVEVEVPRGVRELIGQGHTVLHAFHMGECNILLGREPTVLGEELRWHMTISCVDRHPTWDEIKVAKYRLTGPDLPMAILLPPVVDYVNVASQDHVFQLWEIVDECQPWL